MPGTSTNTPINVAKMVALDIETDTDAPRFDPAIPAGLDPRAAAVTSIALYSPEVTVVFDDRNESRLLRTFANWLNDPTSDVEAFVTWNGSAFDLPYLVERARRRGVALDLSLHQAGAARTPKYQPLPGHSSGYFARLAGRDHIDIAFAYREWAARNNVDHSLKPVAAAHGISMIEVDRENVAALSPTDRLAYNLSDVVGTYELAVAWDGDLASLADSNHIV